MSDSYINNLIKVVGSYAAEYVPTPLSDKPGTGCDLPSLTSLPTPLSPPASPGSKSCVPNFIAFPIVPAPFSLPENCPDGIVFENSTVNILSQIGGTTSGQIVVGASQNSDFCSYSLNIPDIVIPCFPAGPQITGSANITVIDPNSNTTSINAISVTPGQNCQFSLDGDVNILLPIVPCQSGIRFGNDSLDISPSYGASARTIISGGTVTGISNIIGGVGYISPPTVTLIGGGGTGATAKANVANGSVTSIIITNAGSGYTTSPTVVLSNIVDKLPLTITKNGSDTCAYDVTLPTITIPCYPNGPQITGGISVTVTDSIAETSSTQNSTISTSGSAPCTFNLGGPINIDIPCSENGVGITMGAVAIKDPYTNENTSLSTTVTKNDFCNTTITLPTIPIPCLPGGILFKDPIKFHAYTWGGTIPPLSTGNMTQGTGGSLSITGVTAGQITTITIVSGGSGYSTGQAVNIVGDGSGAAATLVATDGVITGVTITSPGSGYSSGDNLAHIIAPLIPNDGLLSNQTIDLSNNGTRDQSSSCTWNTGITVNLPVPDCSGGFVTTTTFDSTSTPKKAFNVIVNGNPLPILAPGSTAGFPSYNSIQLLQRQSTDDLGRNICNLSLEGDIALGFPCATGYETSLSPVTVTDVSNGNVVLGTINVTNQNCTLGLTGNIPITGLLPCAHPAAPAVSISFVDSTGAQVPSSNTSNLTFNTTNISGSSQAGSLCNLTLSGKIQFPSSSGGMSASPWNPFASPTSASIVYAVSTEGGVGQYASAGPTSPNDIPGASSKWELISGAEQLRPYEVIKCDSPKPTANCNTVDASFIASSGQQTEASVKVVPTSYLYKDETSNTRIPVFGLDMPFLLRPGEIVYLEVVHMYTGTNGVGTPIPLYGAICKGSAYDFNLAIPGNLLAATTSFTKLLTRQNLINSGYTSGAGLSISDGSILSTYINSSINNYVGLDNFDESDIFNIQALAIKQISRQTIGSVNLQWQFKSWQIIATASNADDQTIPTTTTSNPYPITPRNTGGVQLSLDDGSSGKKYYGVKQKVKEHQAIKVKNQGSSSNLVLLTIGDYDNALQPLTYLLLNGVASQPQCAITTTRSSTQFTTLISQFNLNNLTNTSSNFIQNLINTVSPLTLGSSIGVSLNMTADLIIGTGLNDIKVYYTLDGHMPTINTYASQTSTQRFDNNTLTPSSYVIPIATPYRRISWIGVYPEFAINNPGSLTADAHQLLTPSVTSITWS